MEISKKWPVSNWKSLQKVLDKIKNFRQNDRSIDKIVAGDILKFSLFRSPPSTPNSWLSMPSTHKLALLKLTCQKSEWENGRAQILREGKSANRFSTSINNPFAFGFWLHDLSVTRGQASDEGGKDQTISKAFRQFFSPSPWSLF